MLPGDTETVTDELCPCGVKNSHSQKKIEPS